MKLLIAGDYCPIRRVEPFLEKGEYSSVLGEVKPLFESVDYSIVNLESPIADESDKPIEKRGINIKCGESGVEALKWLGVDCVTLANNHVLDYGESGIKKTLKACFDYGITTVGCGMNLNQASQTLIKSIGGSKVAIINCCEHEFSIATDTTAGANPLDLISQYYSIIEARKIADFVLVIVHGGHEHYQLPSPRMQKLYRFFIDCGADIVVNHHQHCFSGYEFYHEKPIFYGIGNFCFDSETDNKSHGKTWNYGFLLVLSLKDNLLDFELIPFEQCKERPTVSVLKEKYRLADFDNQIRILNNDISSKERLMVHYLEWAENGRNYSFMFPYKSKLFKSLCFRGLLPSFVTRSKLIMLKNIINCESHYDILKYNIENDLSK